MRYVIVLDFGYPKDPADVPLSSIHDLAYYTLTHYGIYNTSVILAQEYTYDRLLELRQKSNQYVDRLNAEGTRLKCPVQHQYAAEIIKIGIGQSNTVGLEDGGSYHVLRAARDLILDLEGKRTGQYPARPPEVILVAHQLHAPRVKRQAEKLGFRATVSTNNLPAALYPTAAQWWCRRKILWYLRELIGYIPLRLAGQI